MRTSVVIPSYNYAHLVGEAIRSVQEQTVDDLEIIVIDDGSTDDTQDVLAAIDDPRLIVRRTPNGGVAAARNTALEMARGEFIAYLDADDRWHPTKLERQLALFESEPEVGLVFTDFARFDDDHVYRATHFDHIEELRALPGRASRDGRGRVIEADAFSALAPILYLPAWPSTTMVRARDAGAIRFPPGVRLCEDLHYMLRLYPHVRAAYIDEPLAELRRHGGNSFSSFLEIGNAAVGVLKAVVDEPLEDEHRAILRHRLGRQLVEIAYVSFHGRSPLPAVGASLRALRFPGSRTQALRRLAMLPFLPLVADPTRVDWTEKRGPDLSMSEKERNHSSVPGPSADPGTCSGRTSVIIASYNYGHLVGEAIRSVQEQTVDDVEIIVIDDGSTDDTPEVLAAIDDPRLIVRRIANGGESVARNTALDMATGEFVAYLDADDRWRPTKLERQLAVFRSEPEVGLVFTDFVRFDGDYVYRATQFEFCEGLAEIPARPSREGGGRVIEADTFSSLAELRQFPAWPSTVMVRRSMVGEIRFPPGVRLCADLHYMLRVYPGVKAAYLDEPLAELRRHGNNSYSSVTEINQAAVEVLHSVSKEELSPDHAGVLNRRLGREFVDLAYLHYHLRDPRRAAVASVRALRYPGYRRNALTRLAMIPLIRVLADASRVDWREQPEAPR